MLWMLNGHVERNVQENVVRVPALNIKAMKMQNGNWIALWIIASIGSHCEYAATCVRMLTILCTHTHYTNTNTPTQTHVIVT